MSRILLWHTRVIELCIKVGWRNNPILWCTVEKTSNHLTTVSVAIRGYSSSPIQQDIYSIHAVQLTVLTTSMEQTPSWEANTYSASQYISCIISVSQGNYHFDNGLSWTRSFQSMLSHPLSVIQGDSIHVIRMGYGINP